ncbi:MAG: hypothetical protein V3V11_01720, partial [Vicinamibacteria bacterium]
KRKLALLAASMVFATALTEVVMSTLLATRTLTPYYRAQDKHEEDGGVQSGRGRYTANVDDVVDAPHGDNLALDPFVPSIVKEPRAIVFKTDDRGHRNDAAYRGQALILSGDSFVVGTTTSQDDILVNVLRREYGIDTYSIAHPGAPKLYFSMVNYFLEEVNDAVSVLLFMFEGNDLVSTVPVREPAKPSRYDQLKIRFAKAVEPLYRSPAIIFNAYRQLERRFYQRGDEVVEVCRVGRHFMGFYGPYIDMACRRSLQVQVDVPQRVIERIKAVFFIPTKYRVYFDFLESGDRMGRRVVNPAPGYVALEAFFGERGIPVIDLTGPMRKTARRLLEEDRYVFWRDDTHWNGNGIAVAAAEVARFLEKMEQR